MGTQDFSCRTSRGDDDCGDFTEAEMIYGAVAFGEKLEGDMGIFAEKVEVADEQ